MRGCQGDDDMAPAPPWFWTRTPCFGMSWVTPPLGADDRAPNEKKGFSQEFGGILNDSARRGGVAVSVRRSPLCASARVEVPMGCFVALDALTLSAVTFSVLVARADSPHFARRNEQ